MALTVLPGQSHFPCVSERGLEPTGVVARLAPDKAFCAHINLRSAVVGHTWGINASSVAAEGGLARSRAAALGVGIPQGGLTFGAPHRRRVAAHSTELGFGGRARVDAPEGPGEGMMVAVRINEAGVGVTGATGRLGGRVARRLAEAGVSQRLLVRDPSRAPDLPGATVVRAGYDDRDAVVRALAGVRTLLMVSASETPDRVAQHTAFVDAMVDAGVEHLVYISFYGAAADSTFTLARDHHATEDHIRGSGLAFTFLRDNLYADFLPALVGADGVIRGPAGQGQVAAVAQDDIADAAVAVLLAPATHVGATYSLTGPQALTLGEVAIILTAAQGRPVRYRPETVAEAYASRASYGAPDWQVQAWVSTYTAIAAGELATVTDDVPLLTGRPGTSLVELLRRNGSAY